MTHHANSLFRRFLGDEKGIAAVLVAVGLVALVGMGALVVDVGYFFYARSVVQASANASALAGAQEIGTGGAPLATATTYSSVAGEKNAVSNLTITMVSGYPKLTCASAWATNSGVACSGNYTTSSCASPPCTPAVNLITVSQTTNVPTFFGRIFGITSIPVSANATASAAGSALTPYNVAVILDTTASMGSTATAAACGNGISAISCAAKGVRTLLGELWPCASGLASCAGQTPVDRVALFTFPPLANATQATADIGCTKPQITTSYSGEANLASAATTSKTLTVASMGTVSQPAFNTGALALVTDAGTPTSLAAASGKILTFPSGVITAAVVGLTIQDTTKPTAIPSGTKVSSSNATTVTMSANVAAGGVGKADWITFGTSIPPGTGGNPWPWWQNTGSTTISSIGSPLPTTSATLSAAPTGAGILKGDTIITAPLYQIVGFANDFRASDTASALTAGSNIVKATAQGCLGTPGGLGTYYADAITAAQTALVAQQAANVAAGEPAGQNVMILLSDGAASASAGATGQMGPLENAQATYECGAAVVASQNAAKNGTTVYVVYYDDNSPGCNDTAKAPGQGSKFTSSCTAMQQIANAPGATAGTFVNDQPKLFYSTDGTSAPCKASASYTSIASIFKHIVATLTNARLVPTGTS